MRARSGSNLSRHLTATVVAFLALASAPARSADLTVAVFGGVWEQSFRKCVSEPWEKATGRKVDLVLGAPVQWLNQIAASPAKPPIDVVLMPTETAYDGIGRGLIDRLPVDRAPNSVEQVPRFRGLNEGYGAVHNYGAMGVLYNPQTVKDPPKSWKEFIDGAIAGKWRVSIPSINYPSAGFTFTTLLLADQYGGGFNDVSPAFAIVKRLLATGNGKLWIDPNQVLNDLKSGEVDMAAYWDGRAWSFIDGGNPEYKYYTPSPGGVAAMTWIQKVKNSPAIADDFINAALAAGPQSCFGSAIRYGTPAAQVKYAPNVVPQITNIDDLILPPFKDIPAMQSRWLEQWNKEVGR